MADKPEFTNVAHGIPSLKTAIKEVQTAKEWFKESFKKISDYRSRTLLAEDSKSMVDDINISSVGSMFAFYYDPKWKDKLPYYDMHPLVFVIELYPDGFLGLNLHYISPYHRAKLMTALYGVTTRKRGEADDEEKGRKVKTVKDMVKLQANYQILKSASKFSLFQHCVKRYLSSHVRSRFLFIDPDRWDLVMMLPTQKFVKATSEQVWRDTAGLGK